VVCPICNKRKAKRLCPARAESICSICCGEQREITIDCPSDCLHLVASRQNDLSRMRIDWAKVPFPEAKFDRNFAATHGPLLFHLDRAICQFAADHRQVVDSDVLAALQSLADTYRTQASGIIYEKPLDYLPQREVYESLKAAIEVFRKTEAERVGISATRWSFLPSSAQCTRTAGPRDAPTWT
jgi:hypothetical protein